MSEFVIYGIPGSPFLRSACLGLEEKGQPYRIERLADMRGETHRSLHPFGRMPTVDHGSFRLYETQAALRRCPVPETGAAADAAPGHRTDEPDHRHQ
jgi:glutathione S-transferase